jgi:hypothetical protein
MGEYTVNRTQTYEAKAVFVSSGAYDSDQTVSGSLRQLSRVQGVDWSINYPVEQVTYLDVGDEAYLSSHNPVDVTIQWMHSNGRNEQALGLVDTVGLSGTAALNLDQEKNLYITIENTPGRDAIGAAPGSPKSIIGMGQALMTSYDLSAQVGGYVHSRATMNCLTAFVYTGTSGNAVPAVQYQNGAQLTGQFVLQQAFIQYDPNITGFDNPIAAPAVGARDMFLTFPEGTPFGAIFSGAQSWYLQGFSLGLDIARRELKPLGSVYPPVRATHYPIVVSLSTDAIVNRYQRDQLDRIDCLATGQSVYLIVKQPCSSDVLFGIYLDHLQIQSQSFTTDIGNADRATVQWRGLITNPNAFFINPWVASLVNLDTQSGIGDTW